MELYGDTHPDLVLLDLMLPGIDGIDVCGQIRTESGVPIVMLTAKSDTVDVVLALESGADDYIVKPFKSKELIARVRARLRRTDDPAPEMLQIVDVTIDVAGHSVKRGGEQVNLTPLEFDLLVALARKPRQAFPPEGRPEQGWGDRRGGLPGGLSLTAFRDALSMDGGGRLAGVTGGLRRRLPLPARRALRSFRLRERAVLGRLRRRWHRSLQLRVVATTMVISAI